jgi:hypothetical protein
MTFTTLLGVVAFVALAFVVRRVTTPACPRCRSKDWDRKLCAPMLFCRRCATRVDVHLQLYN